MRVAKEDGKFRGIGVCWWVKGKQENYIILVDGKGRESALGGKCECDRGKRSVHQDKQLFSSGAWQHVYPIKVVESSVTNNSLSEEYLTRTITQDKQLMPGFKPFTTLLTICITFINLRYLKIKLEIWNIDSCLIWGPCYSVFQDTNSKLIYGARVSLVVPKPVFHRTVQVSL